MIRRRHTRLIIALLLPLMVLRAMLPAGFMPVTESGRLRMVMCSAGIVTAAQSELPANGRQTPSHSDFCPFALSASSAPPPAGPVPAVPDKAAHEPASQAVTTASTATIYRTQSARAPPVIFT